ncbi:MAG: hypothetical protein ACRDT4_27065 [Micromonosporaceae bacterium]
MFSRLLDGITITAKSPDGKIGCELDNGRDVVMDFAPGSYRRYAEPELGHQLAGLVTTMWVAHRRAHLAVLSERVGYPVRGGEHADLDLRGREFAERRARLEADSRSPSGRIVLRTRGMTRWDVKIKPGTVREVNEETFLQDAWGGFVALMGDHRRKIGRLKDEIFDLSRQRVFDHGAR